MGDLSGVSKATVCRVLQRVTHRIALMYDQKINLPNGQQFLENVKRNFYYKIAGFPGVLGAIDCTHVSIQSPGGEHAELYRNWKGYFSKNVQAVCGPDLRFHNVVPRWYGSAHDSTVFTQSNLYGLLGEWALSGLPFGWGYRLPMQTLLADAFGKSHHASRTKVRGTKTIDQRNQEFHASFHF